MKNFLLTSLAFVFITVQAQAQTIWKIDPDHAKVGFTATHMTVSDVDGYFKDVQATITVNKADYSDAQAEFTAQTTSISTGVDKRDDHLRSPDFFDAKQYPTVTFKSTSFKKTRENTYEVQGNLTMRGVSKPVTLLVEFRGPVENPMNKKSILGVRATGQVNRLEYGVGKTFPEMAVGKDIVLRINAEFIKQ